MHTCIDIISSVREAGIVGAGGAGFPTHVKLNNRVDTYIANGAECEPILETDKHIMETFAPDVVRGLELAMEQVGAEKGFIALKDKNLQAIAAIERAIAQSLAWLLWFSGIIIPPGMSSCSHAR